VIHIREMLSSRKLYTSHSISSSYLCLKEIANHSTYLVVESFSLMEDLYHHHQISSHLTSEHTFFSRDGCREMESQPGPASWLDKRAKIRGQWDVISKE